MSGITTHVLDTSRGRPADGVSVRLDVLSPRGEWTRLGQGATDVKGRLNDLAPPGSQLDVGTYRLVFETDKYFQMLNIAAFYPSVTVVFVVRDPSEHYHVPLLLSPFGYSTYRGT